MKKQILFFALLSTFAVSVAGQSDVERQVLSIGLTLAADGYELTHDIRMASLNDGRYDNYYFTLNRGYTYRIYAVCDGDCDDLDLCVFDENENEIDCDEESDDLPIISVTPKWTGRFRLWVKMYDCSVSPCRFGIAVFGK